MKHNISELQAPCDWFTKKNWLIRTTLFALYVFDALQTTNSIVWNQFDLPKNGS